MYGRMNAPWASGSQPATSSSAGASGDVGPSVAEPPPTDPQVAYIKVLCERLDLDFIKEMEAIGTKQLASRRIDELKRQLGWM